MPFFRKKSDKNLSEKSEDSKKTKQAPGSNNSSPLHNSSNSQIPNGKPGGSASNGTGSNTGARPKTPLLRVGSGLETAVGDLGSGYASAPKSTVPKYQSRLSKPLQEVLYDNHGALPHLIQFMTSQGCPQFVQFWLAAESFGSVTWTKLRTESMNTVSQSTVIGSPSKSQGHINTSNNAAQPERTPELCHNRSPGDSTDSSSQNSSSPPPQDSSQECDGGRCEGTEGSQGNDPSHNSKEKDNNLHNFDEERSAEVLKKAIESDAVNIFTRYLGQDAPHPIGISDELRSDIIRKICREDGQVDPNCFVPAQDYVFNVLQTVYFDAFLKSDYQCKYQVDILTSGKVYLSDILYNESSMFYFMERHVNKYCSLDGESLYIEQEDANDLLQFWLAADNFQRHLVEQNGQYDPIEAQNDAMVLYDRYFSLQATHPVGFSDAVRFEVECNICREDGPLPNCFATSMKIAENTLEKVYLRGFLSSELYFKYLNELMNQIKNEQGGLVVPSPHTRRKRHNSDTGSEHSVGSLKEKNSSNNTLLAEGTKQVHMKDKLAGDMRIDTGNFDPDVLWQRPKVGGMSFGKVNELGQFIAECEPDPDIKKGKTSKLDKVKKWVTGEEHKAQEDMAWQIAQMIINDVSKQTLGQDGVVVTETPDFPEEAVATTNFQRKNSAQSSGSETK